MSTEAPDVLKLLANDLRWHILQLLSESDLRVSEMVATTQTAANQLSYHLGLLRDAGIVTERRSSFDNRAVYYSLNVENLREAYHQAGAALHPALTIEDIPATPAEALTEPARVLFLCTHNSARSQMAEALARHLGAGKVASFSAGTEVTFVKPEAIETMQRRGIDISDQRSEHLQDYLDQDFDYVITVCDSAREQCPIFPGGKHQIHWSFPDPSDEEDPEQRLKAFERVARQLTTRIQYLMIMIAREQQTASA